MEVLNETETETESDIDQTLCLFDLIMLLDDYLSFNLDTGTQSLHGSINSMKFLK